MTDLRTAAQAVIDRWDSPNWSDGTHTRDYINTLRQALASEPSLDALIGVDELANIIRAADGNHSLGAGALAEKIIEAMRARQNL